MSWKNYPSEFRCESCNGMGAIQCHACDAEHECEACDGSGLVGIDRERMDRDIANRETKGIYGGGVGELVEDGVWVGRTDGESKWYYRDYAVEELTAG